MNLVRRLARLIPLAAMCALANAGVIQDVISAPHEIQHGEKLYIRFRLSQPAAVKVTILNTDLVAVKTFVMGKLDLGPHQLEWDGTDQGSGTVAPEAYTWRVEAKTHALQSTEIWEPASLYSRPVELLTQYEWDETGRTISYRLSHPMRIWVRLGVRMGATLRTLVDGEPRPGGVITENWDGLDESGSFDFAQRRDRVVSIFGYQLPQPCVVVSGAGPLPPPSTHPPSAALLDPPVDPADPWWHRRRAFALLDRWRPQLRIEQLDKDTFVASLTVPEAMRSHQGEILDRMLADRVRLKWFIDGHCASEEVDAVMPSLLTLLPNQIPNDGQRHLITANLVGALHQVCLASRWIEPGE